MTISTIQMGKLMLAQQCSNPAKQLPTKKPNFDIFERA